MCIVQQQVKPKVKVMRQRFVVGGKTHFLEKDKSGNVWREQENEEWVESK